jgi:hypothetical protein
LRRCAPGWANSHSGVGRPRRAAPQGRPAARASARNRAKPGQSKLVHCNTLR